MKKVIIIGADGFLGRHLSVALANEGISVVALVAEKSDYSSLSNREKIICIKFDLNDFGELDKNPLFDDADVLFHMAWAGVNTTLKNEESIQIKNIFYGLSVMQFAKKHGVKRVVMPGSAAEYACGDGIVTSNALPAPSDIYSAVKVATRCICQTYANLHNIEFIWAFITSVYGPERNDDNLITYTIKSLLKNERPQFTRLEQQWDYIYIDDLISALILIGEKGQPGKSYPIGSGIHRQMSEYVLIIRDLINPKSPLGIGEMPYKNAKIDSQIIDISELIHDTGFTPVYPFEEGIKKTIEYFKTVYFHNK